MSLLQKVKPFLRLFQVIANFKKLQKQNPRVNKISIINQYTYTIASLAFIWPMKKTKPVANDVLTIEKNKTILENADYLFESGHYEECYKLLLEQEDQSNVEVQWRIARALYNMSKEPKYESSYKKELIFLGYDIISKLINTHHDNYAVHKWYAVLLDSKCSYESVKERIQQLENVKKHMDLAVTLNPMDATILYMLGEWCYQIADMPWHQRKIAEVLFATPPTSTYEDALEYFLRAETAQPRFYSLNLLRIGKCYVKLSKDDQAKYYLKLAASYPAKSNDDHLANKEAAELLKKIK